MSNQIRVTPPGTEGVGSVCGPNDIIEVIKESLASFVLRPKTGLAFDIYMSSLRFISI